MKVDPSMKNQHMDFLSNIEKMVQDGTRLDLLSRHYPEPSASASIVNTSPIGREYIGQSIGSVLKK
jgi:hypothetical protein